MLTRDQSFEAARGGTFDAVVIGGGVSGAAAYRELDRRGFRVLLVDKGDFSSGTSQASGMLVWGGLLYLKNLDLRTGLQAFALPRPHAKEPRGERAEDALSLPTLGLAHRRSLERQPTVELLFLGIGPLAGGKPQLGVGA